MSKWIAWVWVPNLRRVLRSKAVLCGAMLNGILSASTTSAQNAPSIVPDTSLGAEASRLSPAPQFNQVDIITGGAERGQNLFHSFREFSVRENRAVYFNSPNAQIQNILARVTGNQRSEILGTIGTYGSSTPNLFLINPNGIIFGPNASLDMGNDGLATTGTGNSFVATTANTILLGNNGSFHASEPERSNLLDINPSAFFFSALSPRAIVNQSQATRSTLGFEVNGLQVPVNRSLLLVGGDISIEGGKLFALGGRVEVGGLGAPGTLGLDINNNTLKLNFTDDLALSTIKLDPQSEVNASINDRAGGNIQIQGNVVSLNQSTLDVSSPNDKTAGDIRITARDRITMTNSKLRSDGYFGRIFLTAQNDINLADSSFLTRAEDNETNTDKFSSIQIEATNGSLFLDQTTLNARNTGSGFAGDISLTARDRVSISNSAIRSSGRKGRIYVGQSDRYANFSPNTIALDNSRIINTNEDAQGDGFISSGEILLRAISSITLKNSSQLDSSTTRSGDAGNISLMSNGRILLTDSDTFIVSNVKRDATGDAGKIEITAGSLNLLNGAQVNSFTLGIGNAGDIIIDATGAVTIQGQTNQYPSAIFSDVGETAIGDGGTIKITAESLELLDSGKLSVGLDPEQEGRFAQGNGGTVDLKIRGDVTISGANSGIFSRFGAGATGQNNTIGRGGDIRIEARSLSISDRAILNASTNGLGNAGDIFIEAADKILLQGADIVSNAFGNANGNGGNITLKSSSLEILGGSQVNSFVRGMGNGGRINIDVAGAVLISGQDADENYSGINSGIEGGGIGTGGTIDIKAGSLTLNERGRLAVRVLSQSELTSDLRIAGTIFVDVLGDITISGRESAILSQLGNNATGRGGDVRLSATNLRLFDRARLEAGTNGQGDAGSFFLSIREALEMENSQILTFSNTNWIAKGGAIEASAKTIRLLDSNLLTSVIQGDGGRIKLQATDYILALGSSNVLTFASRKGNGGDITFDTRAFFGVGYRPELSRTEGLSRLLTNDRVDVNANGDVPGNIVVPDVTFIQNSLSQLPSNGIDTNTLLSNSCIARNQQNGSFYITGSGGLPTNPGDLSAYPTGTVQPITPTWKRGDAIVEPQAAYQLPNGQLILSRECQ